MTIISLVPRKNPLFGQDFRQELTINHCDLTKLELDSNLYPEIPPNTEIIVSFNPDDERDSSFLERNKGVYSVVHHQLRLSYLENKIDVDKKQKYGIKEIALSSLKNAGTVIVPAKFLVEELRGYVDIEKIFVVRNGADSHFFSPKNIAERDQWRCSKKIGSHDTVIGYVGSLTDAKGFQILERIAKELPASTKLFVVTPNRTQNVERLEKISDCVLLEIDDRTHDREMNQTPYFDLFLSTSLCEVVSMVVVESLLSGVPVLATSSTPFFDELFDEGVVTKNDLILIKIPTEITKKSRGDLRITDECDLAEVCNSFIEKIKLFKPISDEARIAISMRAKSANMESECMLRGFFSIYDAKRPTIRLSEQS